MVYGLWLRVLSSFSSLRVCIAIPETFPSIRWLHWWFCWPKRQIRDHPYGNVHIDVVCLSPSMPSRATPHCDNAPQGHRRSSSGIPADNQREHDFPTTANQAMPWAETHPAVRVLNACVYKDGSWKPPDRGVPQKTALPACRQVALPHTSPDGLQPRNPCIPRGPPECHTLRHQRAHWQVPSTDHYNRQENCVLSYAYGMQMRPILHDCIPAQRPQYHSHGAIQPPRNLHDPYPARNNFPQDRLSRPPAADSCLGYMASTYRQRLPCTTRITITIALTLAYHSSLTYHSSNNSSPRHQDP